MRLARPAVAIALTLALPACTHPIEIGGDYQPRLARRMAKEKQEKLVTLDRWVFFWGLLDDGRVDAESALAYTVGRGEKVENMTVDESSTIAGLVLGWLTLGLVNEHEITIKGNRVPVSTSRGRNGATTQEAGAPREAGAPGDRRVRDEGGVRIDTPADQDVKIYREK